MSDFNELLKSLEAAADEQEKGAAAGGKDDETIEAAAADSGVTADDGNPEGDADGGEGEMTKSMTATGKDGTEVEVVDATEMLKSLEAGQAELGDVLAKSMGAMTKALNAQGTLIKSLQAEIKELKGQGRGRKTVVTVAEKPDMTKSLQADKPQGLKPQEVMTKCLAAQKTGALTGLDVARAEIALNNGVAVPADVLARIQ